MNGAQRGKELKKRKARTSEQSAEAGEGFLEQSAGITNILKRFRSVHKGISDVHTLRPQQAKDAAAAPPRQETRAAQLHEHQVGPDAEAAAKTTLESIPQAAQQRQDEASQLPASQSNQEHLEADDAEDRDQQRSKRKQPKQTSDAVLPWMRLPVSITAGQGVQLSDVGGLDPRLRDKMIAGDAPLQDALHCRLIHVCNEGHGIYMPLKVSWFPLHCINM